MKTLQVFILSFFSFSISFGQDMKWPEDRATAELKVALYADEIEFENYRAAADHLHWLLVNAPDLHLSIYQNGAKIYENLAIQETDPAQRLIYLDSLMWMYDTRMQYYNDSVNVMNRKTYKAYRYYIREKDKYEWLLGQFDATVKVSGNETRINNIPAYMNVIKINRLTLENLSLEDVFVRYDNITEILEAKAAKGDDVQKTKDFVDKLLTETIPEGIDCNFVKDNLGPKHEENPSDLGLSKRIFSFMLNGKCTDDPLFLEVAKEIQKQEPTYGMAHKVIGKKCLASKDYECAEKYLLEALSLASNDKDKSEVHNDIAKVYTGLGRKEDARDHYRLSLQSNPGNKEAYEGIGNLYYYNASDCAAMKDVVEDRLPYIAAYQMFEKAGNQKMMQASKEQFPSKEEIFATNLTAGQVMTTHCWINESVVLKTRD
jgi:tetratricopeptide (TPR) repeat protein